MSMLKEFKDFAMKGNVMDLAVGVVIGAAFGKIVSSLVDDILMPLLGILLKGVDFTQLTYTVGGATIKYGIFIQNTITFLVVAFAIFFFVVKPMNRLMPKKPAAPSGPTDVELLTEIRDLMKKGK